MKQVNGMKRTARHLALAGLVCAAVAGAAGAARAEARPMASRSLLEKRITDVSTNLSMKICKAKEELIDLMASYHSVDTNTQTIAKKNAEITYRLFGYALQDIKMPTCTNIGERVTSATESKYEGCYLAWDGKRGWTTCATNSYAGICSWQKMAVDGTTTNYTLWVTTPEGERYDCVTPIDPSSTSFVRTYICTTNNTRKVELRRAFFDDESYRVILGIE